MDFDQLHTFLEIVRLKSFSKAAQTCYRTQPAISAQVDGPAGVAVDGAGNIYFADTGNGAVRVLRPAESQ